MQPAQHAVQVGQAGGNARKAAVAAVGLRRHVHRALESVGEADESRGALAVLGQGVERLFGVFDLLAGGVLGVALGAHGDVPADADQLTAQGQVVNQPAVIGRVGGGRGAVHQIGQVA